MNTSVSLELDRLLLEKNIPMPVNPTIAEVVMWLYEKHGIWVSVYMLDKGEFHWEAEYNGEEFGSTYSNPFPTPTDAYEEAIKYILFNHIYE